MIIKNIELKNFCQHHNESFDFGQMAGETWVPHSHVGVIGQNGSGKSNVLHSFEYALVGDLPDFKKEDLLSWGEDKGHVKMTFVHDNKEGIIKRAVNGNSASFQYGDVNVKGITKVNNAIADNLGMTKDICRNGVFVHQADIDGILFDTQANREKKWQHLVGLHDMDKIHTGLGKFLTALPAPKDYQSQKNLLDEQSGPLEIRQKELMNEEIFKVDINAITAERDKASEELKLLREHVVAVTLRDAAVVHHTKAQEAYELALQNMVEKPQELEPLQKNLNELLVAQGKYKEHVTAYDTYQQNKETVVSKKEALMIAGDALYQAMEAKNPIKDEDYKSSVSTLNEAVTTIRTTTAILSALEGASLDCDCPVCLQPIMGDAKNILTPELHERIATAKSVEEINRKIMSDYENWSYHQAAKIEKLQLEVHRLKTVIATTRASLDATSLDYREAPSDQSDLQAAIQRSQMLVNTVTKDFEIYNRKDYDRTRSLTALNECKELLDKANKNFVEITINQSEEELVAEVSRLDDIIITYQSKETDINNINRQLDAIDVQRATIASNEIKDAERREFMAYMTRVRGWFHYSKGPHNVSVEVLRQLTPGVNKFLGMFNSNYSVETDYDSLSYRVLFHDSRPTPPDGPPMASVLSGGQRIMLALAFRMACYYMFASKFGIMTLDEPTVYLDDTNVSNFVGLFETLHSLSTKLGIQMFISTHERSLIPVMDHFIDLKTGQV